MKTLSIACSSLLLLLFNASHAALNLTIDFANETLSITGSDTGTPLAAFGDGLIQWNTGSLTGATRGTGSIDGATVAPMFSTSVGSTVTLNSSVFQQGSVGVTNQGGLGIVLRVTEDVEQTITGTGLTASFSDWDADGRSVLAAAIGSSMNIGNGTGFSAISVVPEAGSFALIGGLLALSFVACRRKRLSLNHEH